MDEIDATGKMPDDSVPQIPATDPPQETPGCAKLPRLDTGSASSERDMSSLLDSFADIHYSGNGDYDEHMQGMSASGWAIPWSDLMMTMFVLFAVMLSYVISERSLTDALIKDNTVRDKIRFAPKPKGPVFNEPGPEQILEISRKTVKEANIEEVDVVMDKNRAVHVNVRGSMLFDLGSAELREETKDFLRRMSRVLGKMKNEVQIVGHTDNFPIHSDVFPTNWELSTARAARIGRFLIEQGSLDPGRFTITGNAMYRPSVPNTTPENKQKNRRVEIIITPDLYDGAAGGVE